MYDADSEEVNLFSGIENDDGDTPPQDCRS